MKFLQKIIFLFAGKHYRYIISGLIIFFLNLLIAKFVFSFSIFTESILMLNLGNILATETAFLISFPIHKFFTWLEGIEDFFVKLLKFHVVSVVSFLIRYLIFFILTLAGLDWLPSTLMSMLMIILINFIGFDRYVFRKKENALPNSDAYAENGGGTEILETIEEAKNYNTWLCEKIEDYLGMKNIELGAGTGTLSEILSEKYELELFEVSGLNLVKLKKRFSKNKNIKGIYGDILKHHKFEIYDCIYSSNVLEHIENDDAVVEHSLRLLKKGGFFVALVPAMPILYSKVDSKLGHFRRYSRKDKKRFLNLEMLKTGNAELLRFSYFNPVGALGWFIKMKILKSDTIRASDAMIMNLLIPYISILDYLPLPFGQSILIVIQKKIQSI
ncbi:MAG: methyltransferase [Spirochaetia bacterium]|nr:methyltransferase [Spirochaetia bacterium]